MGSRRYTRSMVHDGPVILDLSRPDARLHPQGIACAHANREAHPPERQLSVCGPLLMAPLGGEELLAPVDLQQRHLDGDGKRDSIRRGMESADKISVLSLHLVTIVLHQLVANLKTD